MSVENWESLTDEELRAEMESSENDANTLALWDEDMYDFTYTESMEREAYPWK